MIRLNKITKTYGDNKILDDMSYEFGDYGIACILGASGCGKTTLLNLIAGFDTQYSGKIDACGDCITQMNKTELCDYRKNHVGFVFQSYHLIRGYTVLENILLAAELNGKEQAVNIKNATELITKFGIKEKLNEKVENLSGGQKQRVAIARALINSPELLLADEPTGALDRETSTQIMNILKELSKDRLVIIITHDQKICEWADEIVTIDAGKMQVIALTQERETQVMPSNKKSFNSKPSTFKRACNNFKNHMSRYIAVSLAVALGLSFFMMSLSSKNLIKQSIEEFKAKNTAFNNGYIKLDKQDPYDELSKDSRVENLYYQYILENLSLELKDKEVDFKEKIPMPKATENMSYGVMPQRGKNEIAITPSVAKKFTNNATELIGQMVMLNYQDVQYPLMISGIYNAGYDDFFVSADLEQELYKTTTLGDKFSVSYDVKSFSDVVSVNEWLKENGYLTKTAAEQVAALESTFNNLSRLFLILSVLVLAVSLFICIVLLTKLMNSRFHEVGLLSAIGYHKKQISAILSMENTILSCLTTVFSVLMLLGMSYGYHVFFGQAVRVNASQLALTIVLTFITILCISMTASLKLMKVEPAQALRK